MDSPWSANIPERTSRVEAGGCSRLLTTPFASGCDIAVRAGTRAKRNTRAELIQAFEDYQAGRLGTIPATPRPGHEVLKETTEPR
jgi:hypothetical protein